MSRLFRAVTLAVLLMVVTLAAFGDERQVKAQLRDAFVGKPVALRMPWAGEKPHFDALGRPAAKMKTEAWLANTVVFVYALDLDAHRLRLRGTRAVLVYDSNLKTMAAMPGYERVEITFQREHQNDTAQEILVTTSKVLHGPSLQGYLAQHWQPQIDYIAEMKSRAQKKEAPPAGMQEPPRIAGLLDGKRPVYLVRPGTITPPKIIEQRDPDYDPILRSTVQHTTKLFLVVNEQGEPEVIQLADPVHSRLDGLGTPRFGALEIPTCHDGGHSGGVWSVGRDQLPFVLSVGYNRAYGPPANAQRPAGARSPQHLCALRAGDGVFLSRRPG